MDSLGKKCNSRAVEKAKPSNSMLNANTGFVVPPNVTTATAVKMPLPIPAITRSHITCSYSINTRHAAFAPIVRTTPAKTSMRRLTRATNIADNIAPKDRPPRSAPQTLPTCSSVKPTFATRAVLSTGTLTITVYPTSAMKRAMEIDLQPSNLVEGFAKMAGRLIIDHY